MNQQPHYILQFKDIRLADIKATGGKNASLGELFNQLSPKGIHVPDGFAVTSYAYWHFMDLNQLKKPVHELLAGLDRVAFANLSATGEGIRSLLQQASLPDDLAAEIRAAYRSLVERSGGVSDVAVRSSATAEDLPHASFAGQHESYLNIVGEEAVLDAVHRCMVSLFTDRAIKYREDNGFDHLNVGLSVGVQRMVRSDKACSGVAFTLEPESGNTEVIHIAGAWGLGESIVQGIVNPDEFLVFKKALQWKKEAIVSKRLGSKAVRMVYAGSGKAAAAPSIVREDVPPADRERFTLSDAEVTQLALWCMEIEKHYKTPMDIEWAKDGNTGQLFIVQARPETVHGKDTGRAFREYSLKEKGKVLASGNAVGSRISAGRARILASAADAASLENGDILVTDMTNPDWDPLLKKVSGIITNKGGRTSHASIVARELGVAAIVGTGCATTAIRDGQVVTISCAEGKTGRVYDGRLAWEEREIDTGKISLPQTRPMLITGDPEQAFRLAAYPNEGVGLMRLEFVINSVIGIHPMALARFDSVQDPDVRRKIESLTRQYTDKKQFFIDKLSQAVATVACAFYPRQVIVRMSDFKSNEYARLKGGSQFEPDEENPMIGFRGASRYYHERYREAFEMECAAMKVVRENMGLTNVTLMIPFCRTVEEAAKVTEVMAGCGLKRGENGLELYMMCEIPSNVLLAGQFARYFDGFSIGSNDLTQLTLGIDRDNALISDLFDEKNDASRKLIASVIKTAKKEGLQIGLCGQAPSDFPEFAAFLVRCGIDSISFNPDALLRGIDHIRAAEKEGSLLRQEAD